MDRAIILPWNTIISVMFFVFVLGGFFGFLVSYKILSYRLIVSQRQIAELQERLKSSSRSAKNNKTAVAALLFFVITPLVLYGTYTFFLQDFLG